MAVTMTDLGAIVPAAIEPGDVVPPTKLLVALQEVDKPLVALMDEERRQPLYGAFQEEFGAAAQSRMTGQPLADVERQRLVSLVRWLIQQLRAWPDLEVAERTLVAIILVAACLGGSDAFWRALPDDIATNVKLSELMAKLIAGTSIQYTTRGAGEPPINESETIAAFQAADAADDWITVFDLWPLLKDAARADAVQRQISRYLARFSPEKLGAALGGLSQTPAVMILIGGITVSQKLQVAAESSAPRVQLCCLFQAASREGQRGLLAAEDDATVARLLSKMAADSALWLACMTIFNTHAVRAPNLQRGLGRALAERAKEALAVYVRSIALFPWAASHATTMANRRCVAECLRSFAQAASLEQRRTLWALAHERWLAWDFSNGATESVLTEICRSDLDYAVAAYAKECMTEAERNDTIQGVLGRLQAIENEWHPSLTACISAWNRLLSRMQPYAHASAMSPTDGDLLSEQDAYWPFDKNAAVYPGLMFQIRS